MATTTNSSSRKPRPKRVPVTAAPAVALSDAYDAAVAWWAAFDALDDLDLGSLLEDVLAVADTMGIGTVEDLHRDATKVIAQMAGVSNVSQFTAPATAERLHQVRNTIAAFTFATEVHYGTDPFGPYDLIANLPSVAPRYGSKSRPATDDEVLLTRSRAIHSVMRAGRYTKSASQYALAESGAHPVETTAVRPCDFDDITNPRTVMLPGGTWYQKRRVVLTPFARRILAVTIDAYLAARPGALNAWLCSDCTTKGSSSASATANLKRHAEEVGITTPALEGTYATRWRAHKELQDAGVIAALYLIGKNHADGPEADEPRRVYEFLNLPRIPAIVEVEDDDEDDEDLRNFG